MPTDKTVPLPDHECKYCKTGHAGCCSKACVLKLNPNYPLPGVPTESRQSNELQECLEKLQKQWPYCEKSTIELAIRLASLPVGESRWISVSERLPESCKPVLIAVPFFSKSGEFSSWEFVEAERDEVLELFRPIEGSDCCDDFDYAAVRAWTELPELTLKPVPPGLGESREPLPSVCLNCKHPKSDHYDHSCSGRFGKIECNCHTFIDRCRASRLR